VYSQRYVVIKKLGKGYFSAVWTVKNRRHDQKHSAAPSTPKSTGAGGSNPMQYLALKIPKSTKHYAEAAIDKIELLDCIAKEWMWCESVEKSISSAPCVVGGCMPTHRNIRTLRV